MRSCSQGRPGGLALVACSSILTVVASAAADFHEWTDTSEVFMNTSAGGANVATTMIGFPLLVRLDKSAFDFSEAQAQGQDIRFSNSGGAPLPYQIERWDAAAGKAEIWVLADTVKGNNSTQRLRMYWGNASAADSSNGGAVFPTSKNLVSVFHLGASGTSARANSVTGGNPATPVGYDGDETKAGIIGLCDSLDGAATGDYLNLGAGYANFSGGFTYSAWVYPAAVKRWSHFLDLGNPLGPPPASQGYDNIIVGREDMTNHLITHLYLQNDDYSLLRADEAITNGAWQFFTVVIANTDSSVKWYKNGVLFDSKKMAAPLSNNNRTNNWLGRSGWVDDQYFQGKFDEVRISKTNHSATWIKLSYESQRPDQIMVTFKASPKCQSTFVPPADVQVNEGAAVNLSAKADCAGSVNWSPISGPAPRILDPDTKVLQFAAPRVAGDTVIVYRFTANYGDTVKTKDVRVTVKEAIPEPVFTMPASLTWNGKDSLKVTATFINQAAIKASRDSIVTWEWKVETLVLDTAWRTSTLMLRNPTNSGLGKVTLCLSNGLPPLCKSTDVMVTNPTALAPRLPRFAGRLGEALPARALNGRWMPDRTRSRPAYPAVRP